MQKPLTSSILVSVEDDPRFVQIVSSVLGALVDCNNPEELYLLKIDNWFDHKWLRFSGKGPIGIWKSKVTVPPFVPNRVASQRHFVRRGDVWEESQQSTPLHSNDRRHSVHNLQHRIGDVANSACFLWYSSNTAANDRASMMAYISNEREVTVWYASFRKNGDWKVHLTKGVSRNEVEQLAGHRDPSLRSG